MLTCRPWPAASSRNRDQAADGGERVKRVLITGAGTGFGHEVAMRLAEKGFDVVAAVEICAQVQTLKRQAAERGVTLQVEKLDVTDDGDRRKALAWDIEILVNNAGVGEGGSTVDIPAVNIRSAVRGQRHRAAAADPGHRQADGQARRGPHRLGLVPRGPERQSVHRHLLRLQARRRGHRRDHEPGAAGVRYRGRDRQPGSVPHRLQRPHVPDLGGLGGRPVRAALRLLQARVPAALSSTPRPSTPR